MTPDELANLCKMLGEKLGTLRGEEGYRVAVDVADRLIEGTYGPREGTLVIVMGVLEALEVLGVAMPTEEFRETIGCIVLDGIKVTLAMQARGGAITFNEPDPDYEELDENQEDSGDKKEVIH